MRRRKMLIGGLMVAALVAGGVYSISPAKAAVPDPVAGNLTILAVTPRVVPLPGTNMAAGETKSFEVGGKTFGTVTIPANATGVVLAITATNSTTSGYVTAWTTDAGQPGTPTVSFTANRPETNIAVVALNDAGKFNVFSSVASNVRMSIQSYVTPPAAPLAPVVKTVGSVASKTIDVGGSIRTRATEFATITLGAGTWDARVLGGFTGLNNVNNTVPAGVNLTGTMIIQKGADMGTNFENNVTVGGIVIPRSASDTLTQDPTASINTFITLTEETELHIKLFAYASNSSQAGSGELKANLQGAQFVKVG